MEIGSLSSLAEVGVGINMAFGLIASVRTGMQTYTRKLFVFLSDKIGVRFSEIKLPEDDGNDISEIISDIRSDATEKYCSTSDFATVAGMFLSLLVALSLTYFLYEISKDPTLVVAPEWSNITLGLTLFSIAYTIVFQVGIFLIFYGLLIGRLMKTFWTYKLHVNWKNLVTTKKTKVDPTEVDDKENGE